MLEEREEVANAVEGREQRPIRSRYLGDRSESRSRRTKLVCRAWPVHIARSIARSRGSRTLPMGRTPNHDLDACSRGRPSCLRVHGATDDERAVLKHELLVRVYGECAERL